MSQMVQKYIAQCVTCLRAKPNLQGERGRLKPNEVPTERMQSVTMDFIVGLPPIDGYTILMVIVERLTKKVFMLPFLTNTSALDVARRVYGEVFSEHGIPLQIISDRDSKFTREVWKGFFTALGTKLTMSYSYHQRSMDKRK